MHRPTLVWPMRWHRSMAWSSMAAFHQGSTRMTRLAQLRFRPRLAALSQGLTLVHFSAQREHYLWDTLGTFSR
jgi:hypothetical protein